MEGSAVHLAAAVRLLSDVARRSGLAVPAFRSPPRLAGVDRTVRRRSDGGSTVAVRVRGRVWPAVLADLIDGVAVVNELDEVAGSRWRDDAWQALERAALVTTAHEVPSGPSARVA